MSFQIFVFRSRSYFSFLPNLVLLFPEFKIPMKVCSLNVCILFWKCSYKILAPQAVDKETDPKKIAQVILDASALDVESYRLGHTKACLVSKYQ